MLGMNEIDDGDEVTEQVQMDGPPGQDIAASHYNHAHVENALPAPTRFRRGQSPKQSFRTKSSASMETKPSIEVLKAHRKAAIDNEISSISALSRSSVEFYPSIPEWRAIFEGCRSALK